MREKCQVWRVVWELLKLKKKCVRAFKINIKMTNLIQIQRKILYISIYGTATSVRRVVRLASLNSVDNQNPGGVPRWNAARKLGVSHFVTRMRVVYKASRTHHCAPTWRHFLSCSTYSVPVCLFGRSPLEQHGRHQGSGCLGSGGRFHRKREQDSGSSKQAPGWWGART